MIQRAIVIWSVIGFAQRVCRLTLILVHRSAANTNLFFDQARSWLLILDNVEKYSDVEEYLPIESNGSVIVTTRYPDQARHFGRRQNTVEKLGEDQARTLFLELLFRRQGETTPTEETTTEIPVLPKEEVEALTFLLDELDGLVLGIQQMVALIKNGRPSFTRNLAKFAQRYKNHLYQMVNKNAGIKGHQLTTL